MVAGQTPPVHGRGRPGIGYTAVQRATPAEEYRLLAALLAGSLADGDDVVLRACPFTELARSHGAVICSAHRGIVEGALAELDAPLQLESFDPFSGPGLCRLRLGPGRPAGV